MNTQKEAGNFHINALTVLRALGDLQGCGYRWAVPSYIVLTDVLGSGNQQPIDFLEVGTQQANPDSQLREASTYFREIWAALGKSQQQAVLAEVKQDFQDFLATQVLH